MGIQQDDPSGWKKGVRVGSATDGKVLFFIPPHMTEQPEGASGEGIAVDAAGDIYGAEVTVRGLTKLHRAVADRLLTGAAPLSFGEPRAPRLFERLHTERDVADEQNRHG